MIELIRFNLLIKDEWDDFYGLFSSYLSEVCDEEEFKEEIADLHNDELNAQMINQTLQDHNPYDRFQHEVFRTSSDQICFPCTYLQNISSFLLFSYS